MHLCISSLSQIKLCGLKAVIVNNLITTYPDQRSIMEVSLLLGSVGLLGATLYKFQVKLALYYFAPDYKCSAEYVVLSHHYNTRRYNAALRGVTSPLFYSQEMN